MAQNIGGSFAPRCKYCQERCRANEPPLLEVMPGQGIRCFFPKKEERASLRQIVGLKTDARGK